MVSAIFFDFDGVLFLSEPIHFKSAHEVLAKEGIELTVEMYEKQLLGFSDAECFARMGAVKNPPWDARKVQSLVAEKGRVFAKFIGDIQLTPGLESFLTLVEKEGRKKYICTAATRKDVENILSHPKWAHLRKFFIEWITVNDVKNSKPDPETYLLALKKSGLNREQCLVFEDSTHGVSAAKAAGLKVVGLKTTDPSGGATRAADRVFDDFDRVREAWPIF